MLGGRLVLQHDFSGNALLGNTFLANSMGYISISHGYKSGGFNISGTLDPALREYDPESLWNYELGLKGLWLDGRLDLRAALFTMRRKDVQVNTSIILPRPDGSAEFIDYLSNAARGTNSGLEIEATFQPLDTSVLTPHTILHSGKCRVTIA